MSKEEELKKYDHAASLTRQIERINTQIVKGLEGKDKSQYGNYLDSIIMGLMTIENFYISPFTGDDYDKFSDWKIIGKSNSDKIKFIFEMQEHLAKTMDEGQMFFTMFEKETLGSKDKLNNGENS